MTSTTAPAIETVAPGLKTRVAGDFGGTMKTSFLVGIVALIASIAVAIFGDHADATAFYFSYLVAYMFVLSLALGAMFFVLIQHITRAGWSVLVRRIAENMMGTLPYLAILFIPIAWGSGTLYEHWMHAELTPGKLGYDELVAGKSHYLNAPFFFGRVLFYFAVWIGISVYFRNASLKQDETGDPAITLRLAKRAAPCLLLFAITITFGALDWIMTIDPHWFSTMFGVTYFAGSVMGFFAALALACLWLRSQGLLRDAINKEHYHDIGKLLFAFMIFWTYVNFSQYMLIFYANLPEETLWYQLRSDESWKIVGMVLIFGHFLAPFGFMMSRNVKRNRPLLAFSAIWLLVMHWFDFQYLIMPQHKYDASHGAHSHFGPGWLDLTTMVALLSLFAAFTLRNMSKTPLIPERDPRLAESLHFHNI